MGKDATDPSASRIPNGYDVYGNPLVRELRSNILEWQGWMLALGLVVQERVGALKNDRQWLAHLSSRWPIIVGGRDRSGAEQPFGAQGALQG